MAAFRRDAEHRFAEDLLTHLEETLPGPCKSLGGPAKVRDFVRRAIALASNHGVTSAGGVTALAEIWIQFGENFQRSPLKVWARNILQHPVLPGDAKALSIRDRHNSCTEGRTLIVF